jgi:hypothetical protein
MPKKYRFYLLLIIIFILCLLLYFVITKANTHTAQLYQLTIQEKINNYVKITCSGSLNNKHNLLHLTVTLESFQNSQFLNLPFKEISLLQINDNQPISPKNTTITKKNTYAATTQISYNLMQKPDHITLTFFTPEEIIFKWSLK